MTEGWLYRNGFDPAFFDDSDMIECDTCKREYDYKEYSSLTCDECENKLTTKEGESEMKEYGYTVEGESLICADCGDNPYYKGLLESVEKEGYPDGYTCADCGKVVK